MRNFMVVCAACALVALVASVATADNGMPSASKMQQMGLSSATVVSDAQAMNVRGMGYFGKSRASAWGRSTIVLYSPGEVVVADNGYDASGQHVAAGVNGSVAGDVAGGFVSTPFGSVGGVYGKAAFAGGFSAAFAY